MSLRAGRPASGVSHTGDPEQKEENARDDSETVAGKSKASGRFTCDLQQLKRMHGYGWVTIILTSLSLASCPLPACSVDQTIAANRQAAVVRILSKKMAGLPMKHA